MTDRGQPTQTASEPRPAALPWIVDAAVDAHVTPPSGDTIDRDDFHVWLWEQAEGLLGIDEGTVTAVDAAERGLVPQGAVIDAAAAPADRDWVGQLAVASEAWWFRDEPAARAAVELVARVQGCRIRDIRSDSPVDHEEAWRASFCPIAVPGFGVVRPAWQEGVAGIAASGTASIFIEPGLGFGTGLHDTTQLCLAALAESCRRRERLDRVLDFGSGSGILGIAAAVLGASQVDAVEIDDRVHEAIVANARRNGVVERLGVTTSLPSDGGLYDIVIANIVPLVLIEHAAELCSRLDSRGGALILSGLFAADVPRVADRYAALLGCQPAVRERGEWRCLSFARDMSTA